MTIRVSKIDGKQTEQTAGQKNISIMINAEYSRLPVVNAAAYVFEREKREKDGDLWKIPNFKIAVIPYGVTSIREKAFSGNSLISVTIPNSVTSIGSYAFSDNNLTSVTIPNSVTSIEDGAFNINNLTSVTIPNSVTLIEGGAFSSNYLPSVTIPNSVTTMGVSAFSDTKLTSVTIGANVRLLYVHSGTEPKLYAFNSFYENNGKKAGTYTYNESTEQWSFRAR